MKQIMWMVGWVLVSSFAFGAENTDLPSGGSIPAVRKVAIVTEEGCGVPPRSFREPLPCPCVGRVTFEVETIGPCDVFTTEVEEVANRESYLTIVKQTMES